MIDTLKHIIQSLIEGDGFFAVVYAVLDSKKDDPYFSMAKFTVDHSGDFTTIFANQYLPPEMFDYFVSKKDIVSKFDVELSIFKRPRDTSSAIRFMYKGVAVTFFSS